MFGGGADVTTKLCLFLGVFSRLEPPPLAAAKTPQSDPVTDVSFSGCLHEAWGNLAYDSTRRSSSFECI